MFGDIYEDYSSDVVLGKYDYFFFTRNKYQFILRRHAMHVSTKQLGTFVNFKEGVFLLTDIHVFLVLRNS